MYLGEGSRFCHGGVRALTWQSTWASVDLSGLFLVFHGRPVCHVMGQQTLP